MAKLSILAGATSQTVNVFIQNSSSTVGAGLTGLVYNTSGLTAYYVLPRAASAAITLATLAAATSAYSSGGFKEIDSTNAPGLYRLDLPNAAIAAASGRFVTIYLQGATNMAPCLLEVELTGWDNQDAVHGGLTCLPNTACTTNASLVTSGTGTDQLSVSAGYALANASKLAGQTVSAISGVTFPGTVASTTNITAGTITTTTNLTNAPTAGDFTATMKTSLNAATPALSAAGVQAIWDALTSALTTVGSVGKRIADYLTGDAYARLGAPAGASLSADVAAVKVDTAAVKVQTDKLTFTVANQVDSNVLDWKSATAPAMTGDAYARLGAPAGASASADIAAVKVDTAAVKVQTDKLAFTVANQVDSNVLDWKSATAPAMTGDAYARLGAPVGASISADVAGQPAALLDLAAGIETSWTVRQGLRVMLASMAAKLSGAATSTVSIRDVGDTKDRIIATVDANGNRSAITYDKT